MELRRFTRTHEAPVTGVRRPLADLLAKTGDSNVCRSVAAFVVVLMLETDVRG